MDASRFFPNRMRVNGSARSYTTKWLLGFSVRICESAAICFPLPWGPRNRTALVGVGARKEIIIAGFGEIISQVRPTRDWNIRINAPNA